MHDGRMMLTAAAAGQMAAAAGITAIWMLVLRWMKHMRIATTATAISTV
jgi:hypothetical protein